MRPLALSALLIVAAVGCGVPDTVVPKATVVKSETPPKAPEPVKPTEAVKAAEQDPAKLGEKITDTKVGDGATAEPGDSLSMRYAGRLKSNGQEFDSNTAPGKDPFNFILGSGQVIKGWDIGVKGMRVGGKRTLEIPPELGYGNQSQDKIPAGSTLVFDIELLEVQKAGDANTVLRETIKPGAGTPVKSGDVVTIKYKAMAAGKLIDDNGGKTIQFKVGDPGVAISGMNTALEGMRPGQVVNASIPPALGYRGPGMGRTVPPNSTLKIEITLVKVG